MMSPFSEILKRNESEIQKEWMSEIASSARRRDLMTDAQLQQQTRELLRALTAAASNGHLEDLKQPHWAPVCDILEEISASRAAQGFTPTETATFVLSLKKPIFESLRAELGKSPDDLYANFWQADILIDRLGLHTAETFMKAREKLIARQQEEMLELSTPVVTLWEGVVALPLIGTLDSARTQVVMESLLQTIVQTNSRIAIIDITGVPTVDTLVAQHLLKTITAARLMGAECIISGVRPQIAQTIVHLGINLTDVTTKAKLSDAFALALHRVGRSVVRANGETAEGKRN
jgi:rsbT co-antagonist protein RsbR